MWLVRVIQRRGHPILPWRESSVMVAIQRVSVAITLGLVLVLNGLSTQHMALLTRRMQLVVLSFIDVACALAAALVGLASAWLGARYWSLVLMQAASAAAIMIFSWTFSGLRPSFPRRGVRIGSLMQFGGHVAGHNLATYARPTPGTTSRACSSASCTTARCSACMTGAFASSSSRCGNSTRRWIVSARRCCHACGRRKRSS